ncbi:ABC transporter ATP-binding protein [Lichenibacterium dinghuense]|uniref:ABC transporter ATP-binding protein n=1 Tax=Lichenibacterium dinghuense TaxID=2895977 RepID=UPI001F001F62|nr:ATP-binding cassette domain-containing protein [Lichenibacterium sp. 6Y81]
MPTTPVPTADSATLAVTDVAVEAGGRRLLGPVTLGFAPGAVHGIIGHNGSGKSTLLKLLARQIAPTGGGVALGGEALGRLAPRAFARRVAYLPQALPAGTGLTVRELVEQGRYPWHGALGRATGADRAAVAAALEAAGLGGDADRMADALSGGERQRAWIAMLIAQGARSLLLDEPTAALDPAHTVEVMAVLRRLAHRDGAAVVVVLHDINMAARFCDRLVALKRGRVLADGPPAAVVTPAVLERIYGLPMAVLRRDGAAAPVAVPA